MLICHSPGSEDRPPSVPLREVGREGERERGERRSEVERERQRAGGGGGWAPESPAPDRGCADVAGAGRKIEGEQERGRCKLKLINGIQKILSN